MTTEEILAALQQRQAAKETCPSCGHCPTCGRGGHHAYPMYPLYPQPYWSGPWWGVYPPNGTYVAGNTPNLQVTSGSTPFLSGVSITK